MDICAKSTKIAFLRERCLKTLTGALYVCNNMCSILIDCTIAGWQKYCGLGADFEEMVAAQKWRQS